MINRGLIFITGIKVLARAVACFCLRVPAVFMETPPSLPLRCVFGLLSQDLCSIKAWLSSDTLFSFWSTGPHLSSLLPPAKCTVDLADCTLSETHLQNFTYSVNSTFLLLFFFFVPPPYMSHPHAGIRHLYCRCADVDGISARTPLFQVLLVCNKSKETVTAYS